MTDGTLDKLVGGLKLDGFQLRIRSSGPSFRGTVKLRDTSISLRLEYDQALMDPPKVFVENPGELGPGVIAHLDEANELCVVDRRQYVADRYKVAEQARGIIRKAAEVLERGLTKAGSLEVAEEFPRHWGGQIVKVHFGPMDGFAKQMPGKAFAEFEPSAKPVLPPETGIAVVRTNARLSFRAGQARPNTLGQVLDWAGTWDPSLPSRLLEGLSALGPTDPYAIIYAPNGMIGVQLKVSAKGRQLVKSIQQPSTWRTLLHGKFGLNLPIERKQGQRVDTEYILGTNSLDGGAPLAGRHLVLVGCGAIGGFLCFALAQFGAGLGAGTLTLIDEDEFAERNIARHRLGTDSVGSNKALACKRAIDGAIPSLSISALPLPVERCRDRVLAADLVIDATGEQGVSDLLNAWRLERLAGGAPAPAIVHAWVDGNGAAVETFFNADPKFGCYRCLQPDLSQPPRFPVLRPDAIAPLATGCGEAPFSPYGPAAPMAAAALAADHVVDWARGGPKPLLRNIRLAYDETLERRPTNPTKSEKCPACGGH